MLPVSSTTRPTWRDCVNRALQAWLVPTAKFGDVIRKESATWAPVIRTGRIQAE